MAGGGTDPGDAHAGAAAQEFLAEQGVASWSEMPLWVPEALRQTFANGRAIAAGLTFRLIGDTIRAKLSWHQEVRPAGYTLRTGIAPEKEAAWHGRG